MDIPIFRSSVSELQDILKELCQDSREKQSDYLDLVNKAIFCADSLAECLCLDTDEKTELEKLAIRLWNRTVLLKTTGSLESQTCAKLRQVAFQVSHFCNEATQDENALKKQIVMGIKTGRAWYDCKELEFADRILTVMDQVMQRLQAIFVEKSNASSVTASMEKERLQFEKDIFSILCLKAEVRFAQLLNQEALTIVERAKEMLGRFPEETAFLSMLCYNFGVECFQRNDFEPGIMWLRESFNLGKDCSGISHKTQARTLRLLTNCYMEWACDGWQDSALNAVTLANEEHSHPAGFYLRFQLLLLTDDTIPSLKQALQDLIHHSDCNVDLCLMALQLLKKSHRPEVAFDLRQNIIQKFEMDPEVCMLLVALLDTFLSSDVVQYSKTFSEEVITAHNTGQRLDAISKKQFHVLFWKKAAEYFEKEQYQEAIVWYNYSLSLYSSMSPSEPNLGKLQRNLASCYLRLGETDKAKSAIEISDRCEPQNSHTYYLMFKIALKMDDMDRALFSLKKLVECVPKGKDNEDSNVIRLAAHTALEQEKTELAIPALECLIMHDSDCKLSVTALRCLLRLQVSHTEENKNTDVKSMAVHLRTAYNKLIEARDRGSLASAEIQEEASWFMKMSWNLALQSKNDPFCLKEMFNLCFQLLQICPHDQGNHTRKQNCLLMSCAACLQLAREADNVSVMQNLLEEVLQHIEEYRQVDKSNQNSLFGQGPKKDSSLSDMFLVMYEFEALTKLKDARAESVLERSLSLPNPDPKLFHTLAVLATDSPANNQRLAVRALKVAIRLHLQADSPDFIKCSTDVRTLIELSMKENEDEALNYLRETLDVIDKRAKDLYPEIEVLWLMTKSWNCGLQHYNCSCFEKAEQWCSTSLRFLKYLPSHKNDYEELMTSLYGEILSHLEKKSTKDIGEE